MSPLSRRKLFHSLLGRGRGLEEDSPPRPGPATHESQEVPAPDEPPQLALILNHFCLAWQGSFCSTCFERCPVPGAITTVLGKPSVQPDLCTGCGICHDVCPAPKNAVFLVSRKPRPGMIGRTMAESAPITRQASA